MFVSAIVKQYSEVILWNRIDKCTEERRTQIEV